MKILLIEDDVFFQKFYREKLAEKGMELETALDGVEGLEKAKTVKPDVIILDIIMPNKDGFEVLESLRKNPLLKKIPVLVFSTLGQEQDVQKAMNLGAKDFVNKSLFDFDQLLLKVQKLVQK